MVIFFQLQILYEKIALKVTRDYWIRICKDWIQSDITEHLQTDSATEDLIFTNEKFFHNPENTRQSDQERMR